MNNDIQTALVKAIDLRKSGDFVQCTNILLQALKLCKHDPDIHYQIAWTYDVADQPKKAIEHYKAAFENGLQKDRSACFLSLGSSLRAVGKYEESKEILCKGLDEFKDDEALKTFLALTLYNLGESKKAVEILLKQLLNSSQNKDILNYKKALEFYLDDLDAVF